MVGNNVDDYLHALLVGTGNERFKLFHSARYIYRQVWVDLVVITYRIGRACSTFDDIGVVRTDTDFGEISNHSMMRNSRVPDVGYTQFFDFRQGGFCEVIKLPHSILFFGAPRNIAGIRIAKKSSEYLINDNFLGRHGDWICRFGSLAGK